MWSMWNAPSDRDYYDQFNLLVEPDPDEYPPTPMKYKVVNAKITLQPSGAPIVVTANSLDEAEYDVIEFLLNRGEISDTEIELVPFHSPE